MCSHDAGVSGSGAFEAEGFESASGHLWLLIILTPRRAAIILVIHAS